MIHELLWKLLALFLFFTLGAVHKRRPQSGGKGDLSIVDILRTRGEGVFSKADVRTFWRKNLRIFWNLWCVHTDKGEGGWTSTDILRIRGTIFRDFVRTFFMDGPLLFCVLVCSFVFMFLKIGCLWLSLLVSWITLFL